MEKFNDISPLLKPLAEIKALGLNDKSRDYCILYNIMQRRKNSYNKVYVDLKNEEEMNAKPE